MASFLIENLSRMNHDLKELDPQLEIHLCDFVELLRRFYVHSFQLDSTICRDFDLASILVGQDLKSLEPILSSSRVLPQHKISTDEMHLLLIQAIERQKEIRNAIEDFRRFLVKEFPFKESF